MREDWIEIEISAVARLYQPKTISSKLLVDNGKYPVYGANGIIGKYDDFNHENEEFLITCRGATCGNVHITKPFSWINGNAMVVQPFDRSFLSLEYLKFVFSNKGRVQKAISGSAQPQITRTTLSPIKIPLAPLPEQRAIVTKIEELFSDLDKGVAELKKAQDQLKLYRQAVLKKAFEGELTKEWREQQIDLPSAAELLEQIKEERQKHYEQQLENWKQAVKAWEEKGKEYSRPSKPKKLTEFTTDFEEKILELPDKWEEGVLEYVADAIDPQPSHRTPPKVEGGIPYISIADIDKDSGEIKFDGARKVGENVLQEHINRYKLSEGDFVIGKIGTIGKPFFIPTKRFFTLSANVVLIRPYKATSVPKYLYYLNLSPIVEQQFKKGAKATTQAAFGIKKVRLLRVPLCSVEEQHKIVQEIESRLSICDKVEESIIESIEKGEALRQSILKKAFEGNLLSNQEIEKCKTEPDYETAAVLLEKIKSQ